MVWEASEHRDCGTDSHALFTRVERKGEGNGGKYAPGLQQLPVIRSTSVQVRVFLTQKFSCGHELGILKQDEHDQLYQAVGETKRLMTAFLRKLTADG
jgi:hypothetical protein